MKGHKDQAADAFVVHETVGGATSAIRFNAKCALFKRGEFDESAWFSR